MTTARMRGPPLRPLNGRTAGGGGGYGGARGKRKSAVELLQETKAFYVKSETVRDTKQQFSHTRSPDSCVMAPMQPAKSPRCSQHGSELQDRLRLLLDVDSKENLDNRYSRTNRAYRESCTYRGCESVITQHPSQHKSLPDLHLSPTRSHTSSDSQQSSYNGRECGDARSAYSSGTQHGSTGLIGFGLYSTKSSDFRRPTYGDYFNNRCDFPIPDPRVYASLRVTKSGELVCPRASDVSQTQYWRRNSNTSSGNRSQHNSSSRHSQSADSGRQSQVGSGGLRTGRSGLAEVISPPPLDTASDSGAEEGSPPLYRANSYDKDKRRPILRSKSDTAYRYCTTNRPPLALPTSPHLTSDQLERFFDHLGMDPASYRELATVPPRTTSPVFFSSASSMDSCLDLRSWAVAETIARPPESLSVVERNARIIKWLCNCRKAQMAELTLV